MQQRLASASDSQHAATASAKITGFGPVSIMCVITYCLGVEVIGLHECPGTQETQDHQHPRRINKKKQMGSLLTFPLYRPSKHKLSFTSLHVQLTV